MGILNCCQCGLRSSFLGCFYICFVSFGFDCLCVGSHICTDGINDFSSFYQCLTVVVDGFSQVTQSFVMCCDGFFQAQSFKLVGFNIFISGFTDGFTAIFISSDEVAAGSKAINCLLQLHSFQQQGIGIFFESQLTALFIEFRTFAKNSSKCCLPLILFASDSLCKVYFFSGRRAAHYGCRNSQTQCFYVEFFHVFYLCGGCKDVIQASLFPVN